MNLSLIENSYLPKPCSICGKILEAVQIPAVLGLSSRWIAPPKICELCILKREEKFKKLEEQKCIDRAFQHVLLSSRFQKKTFETFRVNDSNRKAWEIAWNFKPNGSGDSLLFCGPCGIGKTHLSAAIANRFLGQYTLLYISCPEFLSHIREATHVQGTSYEKLNIAKSVELLVLDDLGVEKSSEWVKEILFILINYRYEYQLSTIFITDCDLEELEKRLGPRIVSRLAGMSASVRFQDQDLRIQLKEK